MSCWHFNYFVVHPGPVSLFWRVIYGSKWKQIFSKPAFGKLLLAMLINVISQAACPVPGRINFWTSPTCVCSSMVVKTDTSHRVHGMKKLSNSSSIMSVTLYSQKAMHWLQKRDNKNVLYYFFWAYLCELIFRFDCFIGSERLVKWGTIHIACFRPAGALSTKQNGHPWIFRLPGLPSTFSKWINISRGLQPAFLISWYQRVLGDQKQAFPLSFPLCFVY